MAYVVQAVLSPCVLIFNTVLVNPFKKVLVKLKNVSDPLPDHLHTNKKCLKGFKNGKLHAAQFKLFLDDLCSCSNIVEGVSSDLHNGLPVRPLSPLRRALCPLPLGMLLLFIIAFTSSFCADLEPIFVCACSLLCRLGTIQSLRRLGSHRRGSW